MIAELEKELQYGRSAATEAASELARLREGKERDLLHVRASHIAELAATREEARREAEESNAQHARAIQEMQVGRSRCSALPVILKIDICLTFALKIAYYKNQNRENRVSLEMRATGAAAARDQVNDSLRLEKCPPVAVA